MPRLSTDFQQQQGTQLDQQGKTLTQQGKLLTALVARLNIYAYDAYMLGCAGQQRYPLLSLDRGLRQAGQALRVEMWEM